MVSTGRVQILKDWIEVQNRQQGGNEQLNSFHSGTRLKYQLQPGEIFQPGFEAVAEDIPFLFEIFRFEKPRDLAKTKR